MGKDGCHGKGQLTLSLETPEKKHTHPRSKIDAYPSSVDKVLRSLDDSACTSSSLADLPEKYVIIANFFDKMECSVRLLNLRKKMPSFRNISSQVEVLTKRKFMYHHLAQIKHIFPEAIHVEKILVLDGRTSCVVPDMKITLLPDVIETSDNCNASEALRKAFRARLSNFLSTHQKDTNFLEDVLPEPFNCQSKAWTQELSLRSIFSDVHDIQHCSSLVTSRPAGPIERDNPDLLQDLHCCKSTPVRTGETYSRSMLSTPEPQMPKISKVGSPLEEVDDTIKNSASSARKSLSFSLGKTLIDISDLSVWLGEWASSILSANDMPISVERSIMEQECNLGHVVTKELVGGNESKILNYENSNANALKRKEVMLTGLPVFFDCIRHIFQLVKSCSITKQELIHKILFHNLEIEDAGEVEEQLNLLGKLVPDWICGKIDSIGDCIYCIPTTYDPEAIRARLVNAR